MGANTFALIINLNYKLLVQTNVKKRVLELAPAKNLLPENNVERTYCERENIRQEILLQQKTFRENHLRNPTNLAKTLVFATRWRYGCYKFMTTSGIYQASHK